MKVQGSYIGTGEKTQGLDKQEADATSFWKGKEKSQVS